MPEQTNPFDKKMKERLEKQTRLNDLYDKMIVLRGYLSAISDKKDGDINPQRSEYIKTVAAEYDLSGSDDALIELWKASQEVFKLEGNIPEGISLEEAKNLAKSRGLTQE